MFRQEEVIVGGWQEKTIEAMQRRRFEQMVSQLPPLGAGRLEELSATAFERKLEQCWQDIERKPMRTQQLGEIWRSILSSVDMQADCLSHEEHALVEKMLILGGSAPIEDTQELEAAHALSLRLWASVGLISGKPYIELESPVLEPVAKAFARVEHDAIRQRLNTAGACLSGILYRMGAMDDRQPQQFLLRNVFAQHIHSELYMQLIRRYLWASYDCVDYCGSVMLVHSALAEPKRFLSSARRRKNAAALQQVGFPEQTDILPEEIPLQQDLERSIRGALRTGFKEETVARSLRLICKQGAPLSAMEEILQSALIVYRSASMRAALSNMYYCIPKWIECSASSLQ